MQAVEQECGFLKIQSYVLDTDSQSLSGQSEGVSSCLRFFVTGLPWDKSAKWLRPLLISVAVMVKKRGFHVAAEGDRLLVSLDAGIRVSLDFAAARHQAGILS